ncbi:MAG: homogentisate 1,2-dioxygenase [Anaerolineales bacterium]|nr:homogentisate 1,2-dioxygenase [Anaerolineales bacterium]
MPFYHTLGQLPHKRHIQFRKPNGELYREQVMGLEGFSGMQSISYHHYDPTRLLHAEKLADMRPEFADFGPLRHRHFVTMDFPAGGDMVSGRRVFLGNNDVLIGVSRPTESMSYFYRNGQAYEMFFVHDGEGTLRSNLGNLDFGPGDYVIIPYNVTWQVVLKGDNHRFLTVESPTPILTPKRYRNDFGQLLEHAPFCERDFRTPQALETIDELGEFEVRVKARDELHRHILDHHPLDVVGWDGYLYPFAFNIADFEPITGRVHQPPPVHQTWEGHNYVVCSFVPRLFDYHPLAIPAPYNHANVQSDEVLYYVEGDFMSRKGIHRGSFTLHPSGLPHGPHPGTVEASIGKERTEELAVMIDTFRPLQVTVQSQEFEDPNYATSWVAKH